MKFIVSSTDLLQRLLIAQKVIASKSPYPILDYFLFKLQGTILTVTASDNLTTLKTTIAIDEVIEEGEIAIPAKLFTDTLKELSTQPVKIELLQDRNIIDLVWSNGNAQIPCASSDDYPELPELEEEKSVTLPADALFKGINSTLYAAADEELRPVMNGICFDLDTTDITLAASNAHKLAYYKRGDYTSPMQTQFILPRKPAGILKGILNKLTEEVKIIFDNKNAIFQIGEYYLISRLVEGKYPAYKSVIPKNNTNIITINRLDLLNAVKRVSVFANQATNLISFKITENNIEIIAQDIDFSQSAEENVACEYNGEYIEIGFKAQFLIEILSNLESEQICIKLADSNRPALIQPLEQENANEDISAILMPMRISN